MRKSKKQIKTTNLRNQQEALLNENSPFAVQEAYKAIRTNIIFSIPESGCKKILITSSMKGEEKSTTAVNLAIAFAQNQSRVLLIDCDLRLPTVASKLGIKQTPGLTNLLVGMCSAENAIQRISNRLDVIAAGDIPPNPSELLGSPQMERVLEILGKHYEYIVLDTPPVNTVADAAILSRLVSGVVMVAYQGIATRESIGDALKQLKMADAKVLGFVMTGAITEKVKDYKKGYYSYG